MVPLGRVLCGVELAGQAERRGPVCVCVCVCVTEKWV